MAIFLYDKLKHDRIYKANIINITPPIKKPYVNIVLNEKVDFNTLRKVNKKFLLLPNTPCRVTYPPKDINFTAFKANLNNNAKRLDFFKKVQQELKCIRISSLDHFDANKIVGKKFFYEASEFRSQFNEYFTANKRNNLYGIRMLKFILNHINTINPPAYTKRLLIEVNESNDKFMEVFTFWCTRFFNEAIEAFKNTEIVFFTTNGDFIFKPSSWTPQERTRFLRLLGKLNKLSSVDYPNTKDNDIEVTPHITDENIPALSIHNDDKEGEIPLDNSEVQTNVSSNDGSDIHSTNDNLPNPVDNSGDKVNPVDVDSGIPDDFRPDFDGDVDFDENPFLTTVEDNEIKLKEENIKFLESNKALQEKALAPFLKSFEGLDNNLEEQVIHDDTIMNEKFKKIKLNSITSSYYKKQYIKDLVDIVTTLNNDNEYPMVVTSMEIKDNSDPLNMKDELTLVFKDKDNKNHTLKLDVPRMSHDGFLYLAGDKKYIAKQAIAIPVIKSSPDTVQITTNYAKSFIDRIGDKIDVDIDRVMKALGNHEYKTIKVNTGNASQGAILAHMPLDFIYLSKRIYSIQLSKDVEINLACKDIRDGKVYLYANGNNAIYFDSKLNVFQVKFNGEAYQCNTVVELINRLLQKNVEYTTNYSKYNSSKTTAYSKINIAGSAMGLGVISSSLLGISKACKVYGVEFTIETTRPRSRDGDVVLKCKDGFIVIKTVKPEDYLFANSLNHLNTTDYTIAELDIRMSPIYIEYFGDKTGSRNKAKALMNFETSMIDPITKDILKSYNLPDTFHELLAYANRLLVDVTRTRKNDMNNFRLRDSEIINVATYTTIQNAFNTYKAAKRSGLPNPFSVKKDSVIKELGSYSNVETYSTLSPYMEISQKAKTTFKGPNGINMDSAFTPEIRAYDRSMMGLFGYFTPVSASAGIVRHTSLNPRLKSVRGLIDEKFDPYKASADELFTPDELLNVFTPKHADSPRINMASTQGGHLTPTIKQSPYIIGNGMDKALAHTVGQDFAYKASYGGKVEKIDPKLGYIFLKYDNGETALIDINKKQAKNSSAGFYIDNTLTPLSKVKAGYKFKEGEILAADLAFFKEMQDGSIGFAAGRLSKVALMALPETFEDSCVVTSKISKEMGSYIINERPVALKKNSRIISMAKIGDNVDVNTPLMTFEEIGEDENNALKALEKMDSATVKTIDELGKSTVKAKYTGKIVDIKIYYNADLTDMHPTLATIVRKYIKDNNERAEVIAKYGKKDEIIRQVATEKSEYSKILGNEIDGVVIEFFIEYLDLMNTGNKSTAFTSLKSIIAEVVEEGRYPYSEYRKAEDIDYILSPLSCVGRMVPDFHLLGWSNKAMVELKKQCLELLEIPYN